ncbi:MAG TPA: glycerate kinase, partial [Bacteroidales bacterium]|nr:glycerate kinase [Bacteroidales bacterium]
MKILLAPDSFKGSLSAGEIIDIASVVLREKYPGVKLTPAALADGGEGSLEAVALSLKAEKVELPVNDPLGRPVDSCYLINKKNNTSYIELARASGLSLVMRKADIMNSGTYGTGELIRDAIQKGSEKIILFIGGSATNDAAMGIAHALGCRFLDSKKDVLEPVAKNMTRVREIDMSNSAIKSGEAEIIVASDVNNPFCGRKGAAYVYAPQKGANGNEVADMDRGLKNMSGLFKKQLNTDVDHIPGSGAAGGAGGGLAAMFDASIVSGAELIFELVNIKEKIINTDLVITGEGMIDEQTANHKLVYHLAKIAGVYGKKVYAVCGFFDGNESLKKKLGLEEV